jgi:hypothetical protein
VLCDAGDACALPGYAACGCEGAGWDETGDMAPAVRSCTGAPCAGCATVENVAPEAAGAGPAAWPWLPPCCIQTHRYCM